MVSFQNVVKSYNGVEAVKGISFEVEKGELFGLIGPDGAGKSTLFRMLTTVLLPDSGEILFNGKNVVTEYPYVRKNVGYMPGKFSLYQDLSVHENLQFFATIFGTTIQENYDLIKDIYQQLEPFGNRKAGALSGGMKQKLALSCALIHRPMVLVLDEPTFGVDAVSRAEFWDMLKVLQQKGVTILVSTPYMDEADLCDRVALIQKGSILTVDTPENIKQSFRPFLYRIHAEKVYPILQYLKNEMKMVDSYPFGQEIHVYLDEAIREQELESQLKSKFSQNIQVIQSTASIEDYFMHTMVQQNLTEEM
jgi:ABC-type multidrug transport system ATPase subunit